MDGMDVPERRSLVGRRAVAGKRKARVGGVGKSWVSVVGTQILPTKVYVAEDEMVVDFLVK